MMVLYSALVNRVVPGNVLHVGFMLALASFFKWRLSWQGNRAVACSPERSATAHILMLFLVSLQTHCLCHLSACSLSHRGREVERTETALLQF